MNNISYSLETKTSISNENPMLMNYLIKKLESRRNTLDNLTNILNSIISIEEFFKHKTPTINFLKELSDDFKQAIYAIKALLTENKVLSLSLEDKRDLFKKNFSEKIIKNNNIDIINNDDTIIKKHISKSPKNDLFKTSVTRASDFSKALKNIENDKKRLKSAVKLHFKNSKNLLTEVNNNNKNVNSNDLIIKIMNNSGILNLLNQKLGKDVIKKLIDPNCPKEYYEKVGKIIEEYSIINDNSEFKIPIRLKNNIQAKAYFPKKNNQKYNSFSHRGNIKDNNKKIFDNSTNPYGRYFEKPKFLGTQKYNRKSSKK
jgi:hypothetical protein